MCSTENKETRQGKRQESVRVSYKGRRNKREQKNKKPKNKRKGLHKDRGGGKGFIICEFASAWTIGRKFAKYEQDGKGRKTKKNEDKQGGNGISNS